MMTRKFAKRQRLTPKESKNPRNQKQILTVFHCKSHKQNSKNSYTRTEDPV